MSLLDYNKQGILSPSEQLPSQTASIRDFAMPADEVRKIDN